MKKSLFFAMVLAVICLLPSCKKDSYKDKIIIGHKRGMSITSYKGAYLVEQYSHTSWGYFVDLDSDGQNDIQFHSTTETGGRGTLVELLCKHENIALLGELDGQEFTLWANVANFSFGVLNTFVSTDVILKDNDLYFPFEEVRYIGYKLTENDKSRLGWMKVKLHTDGVELYETAIQK